MKKLKILIFALILSLAFISPLLAQQTGKLYSFANPVFGIVPFADHTWVTDYESRPQCPKPSENYWYSTGACHPSANDNDPRLLSAANADLDIARCIANPNERSFKPGPATAGIRYGIDGVCHQIANRILAATAINGKTPITVEGARGYKVSRFVYLEYGPSKQWKELCSKCKVPIRTAKAIKTEIRTMALKAGLRNKTDIIMEEHFKLRSRIEQIADQKSTKAFATGNTASEINDAINSSLKNLVERLGPEDFQRLFDWPAGEEIILVNPEL
jgi:hypothetical protein